MVRELDLGENVEFCGVRLSKNYFDRMCEWNLEYILYMENGDRI